MNARTQKKKSDIKLMVLVLSICFVFVVMAIIGAVVAIVGMITGIKEMHPMFDTLEDFKEFDVGNIEGYEEFNNAGGYNRKPIIDRRSKEFFAKEEDATSFYEEGLDYESYSILIYKRDISYAYMCAYTFENVDYAYVYYDLITMHFENASVYRETYIGSLSVGSWNEDEMCHYIVMDGKKVYHIASRERSYLEAFKSELAEIFTK
jgi:hypothetical protein